MGTIFSYCSSASTFFIQIHKIHPLDSVSVTTDSEPLGICVGARETQPFPTFPTLELDEEPIASLPTFFYYKFCFTMTSRPQSVRLQKKVGNQV